MPFKIGKNFHIIHMTSDLRVLDLWYYDIFSVRRFMPESYMPAEKRDASLVLLGDLCIEPLSPSFGVDGWDRMPLGRFFQMHGDRFHSLAWYVDEDMGDLFEKLRAAGIECRGTAGVRLSRRLPRRPGIHSPARHDHAARIHTCTECSGRSGDVARSPLRFWMERLVVG